MKLTRRRLLAGYGAAVAGWAGASLLVGEEAAEPRGEVVDFHVHLFGVGDSKSGCFLSDRQRGHLNYRFLLGQLGLSENGRMDEDYATALVAALRASRVDHALVFAQDGRYDRRGSLDRATTNLYVPNDWLLEVCAREPTLLVPCASIHPGRRDALDELDRIAERGARAVKVHPPTQVVDLLDRRYRPFWARVAERGLLLVVHTGGEHASDVAGHELSDPARLVPALDAGCTVVAAHSGFASFFDDFDYFPALAALVEKHERLYCDSAVLASMFRWRNLPRLLEAPRVLERLVHASDFPFTSNPLVFWMHLTPGRMLALAAEGNLVERDFRLKLALGLPPAVFERGAQLLG